MEVEVPANAEAQTAWEQASNSLRGKLSRVGLSPGSVGGLVIGAFVLATILVSIPSPQVRTEGEWAKSWSLDGLLDASSPEVEPIEIERVALVEDDDMRFVVMLSSRDEKPRGGGTDYDPLAIENVPASMVVKERIFDDYALILNKFPAFRGHALLASLDPIDQAARLTKWDLDALHRCATAAKALGFYNSHDVAGSSQVHRHFQLVPVDSIAAVVGRRNFFFPGIFDQVHELPREFWRWSSKTPFFPVVRRLPALHGVAHGLVQLPRRATFDIDFARDGGFADALLRSYVALATDLGILGDVQEAPHNILLSEAWILVVKRAKATARGVAVNGLAFAAILLARDADVFDALVRDRRPLSVLRDVSAAPPPP